MSRRSPTRHTGLTAALREDAQGRRVQATAERTADILRSMDATRARLYAAARPLSPAEVRLLDTPEARGEIDCKICDKTPDDQTCPRCGREPNSEE